MTSSFVSELHRLVNEHRACMNKAEAIHAQFLGSPTKSLLREEIKCYRSAVEICSRLASLYNYSDTQCGEWMERQAQHERKLRDKIWMISHHVYIVVLRRTGSINIPKSLPIQLFHSAIVFFCF